VSDAPAVVPSGDPWLESEEDVGETVLVVDDDPQIRHLMREILAPRGFVLLEAASVSEARARVAETMEIDLCLCDIRLPDGSGMDFARELIEIRRDVGVLMVTAERDPKLGAEATAFGVYGYILKPFRANELLLAVTNALRRRGLAIAHRERSVELETLVRERTAELRVSQEETVRRLAAAIELRDSGTGAHIERVGALARGLAERVGLGRMRSEIIGTAACLHDIGKIGVPDGVLNKKGDLDPDERQLMRRHAEIGYDVLSGSQSELLDTAALIALTHHERFDGSGYPRGLQGDEIPIEGRIVAICDVYDALTSNRAYRPAYSRNDALAYIVGQGLRFDPELVTAFFLDDAVSDEIIDVDRRPVV
jgi:putative two-component system response regulator